MQVEGLKCRYRTELTKYSATNKQSIMFQYRKDTTRVFRNGSNQKYEKYSSCWVGFTGKRELANSKKRLSPIIFTALKIRDSFDYCS